LASETTAGASVPRLRPAGAWRLALPALPGRARACQVRSSTRAQAGRWDQAAARGRGHAPRHRGRLVPRGARARTARPSSADLTADHVHEVRLGGAERGPLVVRCRPCNSGPLGQRRPDAARAGRW